MTPAATVVAAMVTAASIWLVVVAAPPSPGKGAHFVAAVLGLAALAALCFFAGRSDLLVSLLSLLTGLTLSLSCHRWALGIRQSRLDDKPRGPTTPS